MNGWRWAQAAAAAVLLAVSGCSVDRAGGSAAEEVTVLTFAQPNDGAPPPQLVAWADDVGRLTDGSVEIRFENAWRIDEVEYETGTLDDVQAGDVDLAWVGARAFDRLGVTSFQALLAPLLVDSHDLQRAVFEEGIPQEMMAGVEDLGLVGVGVLPGPMRKVLGIGGAFVAPGDFAGAVVGMQDSALAEETFRTLGATAKAVPSSADLDSLDAYEQQLGSITGNGYQEQAEAVTGNLNLWPRPLVIVAGESAYDGLTDDQQQALRQASRSVMVDALLGASDEDEESAAILCDSSLSIEKVDQDGLAAFQQALGPVYSSLRDDPETKRFLDRIETLKRSLATAPDAMDCEGQDETSGAIPNGIYRHTITSDDVEKHCESGDPTAAGFAAGVPRDGLTLEMEINGQRIVQSQFTAGRPESKEIGWTGTYRTYRDTLELIETGYSEGLPLTWSYEGNKLRLTDWPIEDCDGEIVWTAHPWVKVEPKP